MSIAYNSVLIYNKLSHKIKCYINSGEWLLTFSLKKNIFCGRIYDYWFLICKNRVHDIFLCCNYLYFTQVYCKWSMQVISFQFLYYYFYCNLFLDMSIVIL